MPGHDGLRKRLGDYGDVAQSVCNAISAVGMQAPTDPDTEHPSKRAIGGMSDNQLRIERDRSSRKWMDLEWASNFYASLADKLRRLEGADYKGMISECTSLSNDLKRCAQEHRQRFDAAEKEQEARADMERRGSDADMYKELQELKAKVAKMEATG